LWEPATEFSELASIDKQLYLKFLCLGKRQTASPSTRPYCQKAQVDIVASLIAADVVRSQPVGFIRLRHDLIGWSSADPGPTRNRLSGETGSPSLILQRAVPARMKKTEREATDFI
jgi:hypothetical protein